MKRELLLLASLPSASLPPASLPLASFTLVSFLIASFLIASPGCGTPEDGRTNDGLRTDDPLRTHDDGRKITVEKDRSRVRVTIEPEPAPELRARITGWVEDSVRAVSAFYGRFPVRTLELRVELRSGRRIGGGVTRVESGAPSIRIRVGHDAGERAFDEDWELTHEMVHTALPELDRQHHWLEEGLATYVEPIARARIGLVSEEDVWKQFVEGMPSGQPRRSDRGLDHTPTWGRTYWGGALFCLLADVEIRERTGNRLGLRDALVALVRSGWTITRHGRIEELFARMDAAVGVNVLSDLYAEHKDEGVRVDLSALWRRLGVVYERGRVTFDDTSPGSAIRQAITR